jgi:hypothetical protein
MRILFYGPREFSLPRKLFEAIREAGLTEVDCEQPQNSQDLQKRLRQTPHASTLVILCPADRRELQELTGLSALFDDLDLILIVPDDEDETIALAHRLRPRFLCYIDDCADKVGEVAWNILRRQGMASFSS